MVDAPASNSVKITVSQTANKSCRSLRQFLVANYGRAIPWTQPSDALDGQRYGVSSAEAQRRDAAFQVAPLQFVEQGD